jgi:FMN phosphatase YigB (HAD superfamily)
MKKIEAVLFDLDNTLIFFDEHMFFQRYIEKLAPVFSDLWPFEQFRQRLVESINALLRNDGTRTNAERFMEHFSKGFEYETDGFWNRFLRFYDSEFDSFRELVRVTEDVPDVFTELCRTKIRTVIASNPVWPLSVQKMRLSWAGLDDFPFDLITHIENTSYCKPSIEYYREICRMLDVEPSSCLMVGNDMVNDMVVAKIGMKTYLVQDGRADSTLHLSATNRGNAEEQTFHPDFQGLLTGVPSAVRR